MELRIPPLPDGALVFVQRPAMHVPRTLIMKAYWRKFSKKKMQKIDRKSVTKISDMSRNSFSVDVFCGHCLYDAKNMD